MGPDQKSTKLSIIYTANISTPQNTVFHSIWIPIYFRCTFALQLLTVPRVAEVRCTWFLNYIAAHLQAAALR